MRRALSAAFLLTLSVPLWGQKHEVAFLLGGTVNDLKSSLNVHTTSGMAFQANYGYRFWKNGKVAISGEIHMVANPLRYVKGEAFLTDNFASLYLTPGIRVKFNQKGRIQPYGAIGGGYALYEQSTTTIDGASNSAPRHLGRGAFQYGGGVDIPVLKWIGARAEVRDFYTGAPALNLESLSGGVNNIVVSGGFVLRFGN